MRLKALQLMERQEANRSENSRLDAQTRQEIERHLQGLKMRMQTVKKRLHVKQLAQFAPGQLPFGIVICCNRYLFNPRTLHKQLLQYTAIKCVG